MKKTLMTLSMLAFAGCFTMFESDYPAVEMAAAGDADIKVQLAGFEATVTTMKWSMATRRRIATTMGIAVTTDTGDLRR